MKDRLGAANALLANRPIYLIGVMGCGKSRVGWELARLSGRRFLDTDEWIVRAEGVASVSALFADKGEAYFRDRETAALAAPGSQGALVIATGGGIVLRNANVQLMQKRGYVIWLDRPVERIVKTVNTKKRPLLAEGPQRLFHIFAQREPLYKRAAALRFCNDYPNSRAAAAALMAALSSEEGAKP